MTSSPSRTLAALAAALAVPISLAGCATAPSDDEQARTIESSVTSVEHVTGAFVAFTSTGPSSDGVLVNLYVDSAQLPDLVAAADGSLKAIWTSAQVRPAFVHIALAPVEKPADAGRLESNAIDPADVASALGIDGTKVVRQLIMIEAKDMEAHYGAWQEPAE